MSATKYFKDNINRLPNPTTTSDPALLREWNLNQGLLALARQVDQIQAEQRTDHQLAQRIEQIVRGLR